jgi:hypothetical protein
MKSGTENCMDGTIIGSASNGLKLNKVWHQPCGYRDAKENATELLFSQMRNERGE